VKCTYAKAYVTIVYLSQLTLETGKLADPHPGYHAAEMAVPAVGAAVTTDAARAERRREASMPLAVENARGRPGLGKDEGANAGINTI